MNNLEARQEFLGFMYELETEPHHVLHVAKLALRLFDQLGELHKLTAEDRLILEAAGCLHDIGWSLNTDGKEHHKASARLIRERAWRSLDPGEVAVLALVARYHRQSLPDHEHKDFVRLPLDHRSRVDRMAALLRIADGLDRRHLQYVVDLTATIEPERVAVHLLTTEFADREIAAAKKKSDLAQLIFAREFIFTAQLVDRA
jgi:exopolyphosphatase/guanosine-5'-triphosphate,3'-diphosphate pyrophosphatase